MVETIYGFSGSTFFLSNFFLEDDGLTLEHRFQSAKTNDASWIRSILDSRTPAQAKAIGRTCPLREDWEDVRVSVMRHLIAVKFSNADLRQKLLDTGDRELVEANDWGDRFWGVHERTGEGMNMLGKLLMETRSEL